METALTPENYTFLERYIQQETGIVLGDDKRYLLEARLAQVLEDERLASLDALCDRLRRGAPDVLRRRIGECMATHETLFFRDPAIFETLRGDILPQLARAHQATRTLRLWSAACSSGQEPYSLAILLLEAAYPGWTIDILGTDLSTRILERARAGRYLQIEVNRGLPAPLQAKYFHKVGLEWQIADEVRRMVRFVPLDLRQGIGALGSFDLVLCRNVLIYFDVPTRRKILASLHRALAPGGYLLLGASETTLNLDAGFARETVRNTVVYR
jgi:chemotaxis protein methyltransferase CheR